MYVNRWRIGQRAKLYLRDYFERTQFPFPHVELFYWRPTDGRLNFGDYLSRVVVDAMTATRGVRLEQETRQSHHMLAIGSVLHYAQPGTIVWGSGINGRPGQDKPGSTEIDVRAVRGPHTRAVLDGLGIKVPEIYGDPALLLPRLMPGRFRPTMVKEALFVPNLNDLAEHGEAAFNDTELVLPYLSWNRCIEEILKAKLVVASSLHGLIVAEAYGVPARMVRMGEAESLFKYRDYYAGTGRPDFKYATSVAEALDMGGERPAEFDADLLAGAFPFDLWD